MEKRVYFTRYNKEIEASPDDVRRFEKSAIADIGRGREVFIIEKFPKRFFQLATRIRIEKVSEPVKILSQSENNRLFKVILTGSIYG